MKDHLLLFARDPGATNQILAFLRLVVPGAPERLRETATKLSATLPLPPRKPDITLLAMDYACRKFANENVSFITWKNFYGSTIPGTDPVKHLRDRFQEEGITHIATGVSDNDDKSHHILWRAARLGKIPCVTLLDDNTNLAARFTGNNGTIIWPDRVYAVSEESHMPLHNLGIPNEIITTIANLHLTWLVEQSSPANTQEARALRVHWGVSEDDNIVLFASQPIREMRQHGKPATFDEFACLAELLCELRQNYPSSVVVIRPHPRDAPNKYLHLVNKDQPRVIVSDAGSPVSAILAADRVAGMNSMLLQEAKALSRPIIYLTGKGTYQ